MERIANLRTTPLSRLIVSTMSPITTMAAETRNGAIRSTWPTRRMTSHRMNWPISTSVNSTIIDSTAVSG